MAQQSGHEHFGPTALALDVSWFILGQTESIKIGITWGHGQIHGICLASQEPYFFESSIFIPQVSRQIDLRQVDSQSEPDSTLGLSLVYVSSFISSLPLNHQTNPPIPRSETSSVRSSLFEAVEENGRTYHKYKEGSE
jgi:hypothetical protein